MNTTPLRSSEGGNDLAWSVVTFASVELTAEAELADEPRPPLSQSFSPTRSVRLLIGTGDSPRARAVPSTPLQFRRDRTVATEPIDGPRGGRKTLGLGLALRLSAQEFQAKLPSGGCHVRRLWGFACNFIALPR